ncbi:MAG: YqeG family HAD IIIA-type phosphatase [Armatimonadetes bacterium]|nr:YqeG family HAD IIIA-type phosphatase [Armatimonadota bacterium]
MTRRLLGWCRPGLTAGSVPEIDVAALRERGIEALLLDLDNTLVRWRSREVPEEVLAWVRQASDAGLRLCIVSNAGSARRVAPVARRLGIPFLVRAAKPRRRGFRHAAARLKLPPERVAVIGDQVFTDVVGGNRAGMLTILVPPVDRSHEFVTTRLMRLLERALHRHIHG